MFYTAFSHNVSKSVALKLLKNKQPDPFNLSLIHKASLKSLKLPQFISFQYTVLCW